MTADEWEDNLKGLLSVERVVVRRGVLQLVVGEALTLYDKSERLFALLRAVESCFNCFSRTFDIVRKHIELNAHLSD